MTQSYLEWKASQPSGRERVDYMARLADIQRMTDQGPSVGGFARNAYQDVADMVHGIGALPHLAKEIVTEPGQTLPAIGRGLVDWYAEALRHPVHYMYEHPVSALTDLLTLWSAGAGAVGKVGTLAKIAPLARAGELKPIALLGKIGEAAKTKYLPLAEDVARAGSAMPELSLGERAARDLTTFMQGREAGTMSRKGSAELFKERFMEGRRMRGMIGGSLSDEEKSLLVKTMEDPHAFRNPEIKAKFAPDTKLGKALAYARGRSAELADVETKHWLYSPEAAATRPWLPAAFKRLEEKGLTPSEIGAVQASWKDFPESVVANQGVPREVWLGWNQKDRYKVANVIVDSLKNEIGEVPENLVYFPHITKEAEPTILSRFFLKRWPMKERLPSFARKFEAGKDFTDDFERVWDIRNAEHAKFKQDLNLVERVKALALPWNGSPSSILPGYVPFAPDNFLNFKRMALKIGDDFTLKVMARGKGTRDLLRAAFPDEELARLVAEYSKELVQHGKVVISEGQPAGVGLMQVPKSVKRALESSFASKFSPTLKLFWDSPMNFWRSAVLALSPRWLLYNTIGNVVLNTMAGVSPKAYLDVIKFKDVIPPDVKMGFMEAEGHIQHLGQAAFESIPGELAAGWRASRIGKAASAAPDFMKRQNARIEAYFRGANYIDQATREAKLNLVKQGISKWKITDDLMKQELGRIAQDPAAVERMMGRVNEFLFDYTRLGPFERGVVRRFIMPFYSWYKNVFRLTAYTLPVKYPGRLAILRNLGHIGAEQMNDMYRQAGIDPNDLPEFMRGAIPIGTDPGTGKVLLFTTRGPNPLETILQLDLSTLAPPLKLVIERFMGEDLFRKKAFTSPETIDIGGRQNRWNPETGRFEPVTVKPSLPEHVARQFPQYTLLENLARPYSRYSTGSIFNPQPMVDRQGRPLQRKDPRLEALKYFGLNIQTVEPGDEERLSKARKREISSLWRQLQNQAAFQGGG